MHMVMGMLLAGLLGRKRGPKRIGERSSFTGVVELRHLLPGRVRFAVPSLKGRPQRAAHLAETLGRLPELQSVETSPVSGSVLIHFDAERISADLLLVAIVRVLGLEGELKRPPLPAVPRALQEAAGTVNRAVYDQTRGLLDLWSAVPLGLGAVGVAQLLSPAGRALPSGFTLLWWAYLALVAGRHGPSR